MSLIMWGKVSSLDDLLEFSCSDAAWSSGSSECDDVVDDAELIAILSSGNESPRKVDGPKDEQEEDNGLPSLGSIAHDSGNCTPCSYFAREAGCNKGKNCVFCHKCDTLKASRRRQRDVKKAKRRENEKMTAYCGQGPSSLTSQRRERRRKLIELCQMRSRNESKT